MRDARAHPGVAAKERLHAVLVADRLERLADVALEREAREVLARRAAADHLAEAESKLSHADRAGRSARSGCSCPHVPRLLLRHKHFHAPAFKARPSSGHMTHLRTRRRARSTYPGFRKAKRCSRSLTSRYSLSQSIQFASSGALLKPAPSQLSNLPPSWAQPRESASESGRRTT